MNKADYTIHMSSFKVADSALSTDGHKLSAMLALSHYPQVVLI
jgi:hypothetical protein